MPNTITHSNRVAPWLGVGVSGRWDNSADALKAAGMDFTVRQEQLYWQREEKSPQHFMQQLVYDEPVPMFANVRNSDDKMLGCVTDQYRIIQNSDAFSLIDPFLTNGCITHAGMTENGLCFMVAEVGLQTFGDEDYMINLMLTNSFNTKYPCQIIMTPLRIICQNMYRKLIPDRIFLAKHTAAASDKLQRIAQGNVIEKKVFAFSDVIESSQAKHMSPHQLKMLVAMLFPYPKEGGPREQAYRLKADEARTQFIDVYFDAVDNKKHQDTAFGFVNAYFDYLSHRHATRDTGIAWADRKLSGLVSGLDINQQAIKEALR